MKKRLSIISVVLLSLLMLIGLSGCGSTSSSGSGSDSGSNKGKEVVILTPTEDHGWTGSVATFAKEKADEINKNGKYSAKVITSASASEQISQIEDIIADSSNVAGVVILPQDDTLSSAIQQLIDAKIPYVAFDRIIDGVSNSAVANVKGDNKGIGAASAKYFVDNGLKPGEDVYIFMGDTSSVTTLRNQGFYDYLTGKQDVAGEYIADELKWTEKDLKSIKESGAMNWSRSTAKEYFETLLGSKENAKVKWWYTEDDELAMGILEALNSSAITDEIKSEFYSNKPFITACGGLKELYTVLKGKEYKDIYAQLGGLMSVTYNPSMIQIAIRDLLDYLDGKEVTQDHVIQCDVVTSENVGDYQPFE
ncbi:substrate-binding domain-containing protein [Caldifermentibacillus hisashii]|uniref:substrate-binding domain-containing protein n=1 Tax=Caldifermentibacillus hisashii TaxID=996558 RepID=UPI001C126064|nr:substrate-binding domain-containing protein [Caldifermentibacillus hisashii]MBU5342128.1 substrate-binding domain-containing protein [Caldifermentibacillus hisashii]